MEITRVPAGTLSGTELDTLVAEVVDFDRIVNADSGLGPDFDPRIDSVRERFAAANAYTTREHWIGREDDVIVATGLAYLSLQDNLDLAEVELAIHPDRRRRGLGTAIADRIERDLAAEGRTSLVTFNDMALPLLDVTEDGEQLDAAEMGELDDAAEKTKQLDASSGVGSLPRGLPAVEFLLGRGCELKQLERCSLARTTTAADIELPPLEADCEIITWSGPTPDKHLEAMAELQMKMSTDTPGAAELMEEEVWDADRVRVFDRERQDRGETMHVALALRGGQAAGFTEVGSFADRPEVGWQGGTLVAAAHRGHTLGAHLKVVNHRALAEATDVERIYTWNAAENSWMLAINDAAGFETYAWTGLWKKTLPSAASAGE